MAITLNHTIELAASSARTSSLNGSTFQVPINAQAGYFVLDMTTALKDSGDLLDAYIQMMVDGTNWIDVVHFTQVPGNTSGAKRYIAKINQAVALSEFENATALSAASVRNIIGAFVRAKWVITPDGDSPADHSFTFSISGLFS